MSVLEIILSIVTTLLSGGTIYTIATFRQSIAKENNSVQKSNVDLATDAVNNMLVSVNSLMDQNGKLVDRLTQSHEELSILRSEKTNLSLRIDVLEKKVSRMQKVNADVISALKNLNVDEGIINKLKSEDK
jgi:allophanate hydrolase subunit 1